MQTQQSKTDKTDADLNFQEREGDGGVGGGGGKRSVSLKRIDNAVTRNGGKIVR